MTFCMKAVWAGALLLISQTGSAQAKVAAPAGGADRVEQRIFFSRALGREMPYEVVLPAGYASSQRRYAVLYLLHGWQGDETNWVTLTHLVEIAGRYPLIVVTPRAANSWYVDSATHEADRYAEYIVHDLIADVDSHFRSIADAHERAVAGLSMGGYGALLLTLRHPGAFEFAASVSGAFAGSTGIETLLPQLTPSLMDAFGPPNSATRRDNDMDALIAKAEPAKTPYLFLECGTADPLLALNRHVVAELSDRNFAYEYHELPGAHTWTFWDNSLVPMFETLAEHLRFSSPTVIQAAPASTALHR